MATLPAPIAEINLLGTVAVLDRAGERAPLGIAGPTLELFAYLVSFRPRAIRRDHLADLLWEDLDAERSRAALNTALWRVRQATRRFRGAALRSDATVVRLDIEKGVDVDVARLKSVLHDAVAAFSKEDGLPAAPRDQLRAVLSRCDGDFLEGATSSWALVEREECLNLRLRGLTMLMHDAGIRAVYEDALSYGRRILAADPFREAVQCEMMWLYMMTGRRAFALRHYRDYERMLRRELGIAPMAETRAVHDMICADDHQPRHAPALLIGAAAPRRAEFGALLGEIEQDRRSFYRSHFSQGA
ncbi:BTAD domain-containing putative transcriptional regulator [Methylopila sp. M107]|uniref:AfsR/SARP family transcriptional regulator n=1 Tax=Methylopila sp. M107 TaxID=1101190 RepID=UPI000374142D|nr:BTAD domain-containing putative transcriptional regulator [Methylopila sp. M107]